MLRNANERREDARLMAKIDRHRQQLAALSKRIQEVYEVMQADKRLLMHRAAREWSPAWTAEGDAVSF